MELTNMKIRCLFDIGVSDALVLRMCIGPAEYSRDADDRNRNGQ